MCFLPVQLNVTVHLSTADVPASRKSLLSLVGWAYGTPPSPPPSHGWAGCRRSSVPSVETLECPARSPDSQSPSGSCALHGEGRHLTESRYLVLHQAFYQTFSRNTTHYFKMFLLSLCPAMATGSTGEQGAIRHMVEWILNIDC